MRFDRIARWPACVAALLSALLATGQARAPDAGAVALIASDTDHVVIEARAPQAALIAIPAGADPQLRVLNGALRPDPARLVSTGTLRSQRYAVVGFGRRLDGPVRVELAFRYPGGKTPAAIGGEVAEPVFEDLFRRSFLNYVSARAWRRRAVDADGPTPVVRPGVGGPWIKIAVARDAIYRVTCGDLASAGLDIGDVDLRTVKLYEQQSELAIGVRDANGNHRCDGADAVEFWGRAAATRYTTTNLYWLTYGGVPGRRMRQQRAPSYGTLAASFVETVHIEQPHHYMSYLPFRKDADHWFGENIPKSDGPSHVEYEFRVGGVAAGGTASLRLTLGATSGGEHHTTVSMNGTQIGEHKWAGANQVIDLTLPFPATLLRASATNVIRVDEHVPYPNIVWTKEFDVAYSRTFSTDDDTLRFRQAASGAWRYRLSRFSSAPAIHDVTDPTDVVELAGRGDDGVYAFAATADRPREYVATSGQPDAPVSIARDTPSDLRAATNGADYIVITPAPFVARLQPLVQLRASRGMRVRVVDIQDVYDEFSGGLPDAQAIRDFLHAAYVRWQPPAPSYVLLAGDGHFDFKNAQSTNEPNPIPPYLQFVDPWWGETASDNRLVAFNLGNTLPSLLIGRLPADTPADVAAMVDKIVSYDQHAPDGAWRSKVTLVADRAINASGVADDSGNFWNLSDAVLDRLKDTGLSAERIYFNPCTQTDDPACALPYPTFSSGEATRRAVIDAIDEGRLIVQYIGHSTFAQWSGEGILGVRDLDQLRANGGRYPVLLGMTCLDGYFHYPGMPSLAESAVRLPGRGAVASWSPSGLGIATGHDALLTGFFDALAQQVGGGIGADAFAGKQHLWLHGGGLNLDLIDTFNLLGDPATPLAFARAVGRREESTGADKRP